jgi:hypothetical protein
VALTIDTQNQWPPKVLLIRGAPLRSDPTNQVRIVVDTKPA